MKEDFLHYIWRFKKFRFNSLRTTEGELLTVVSVGQYLQTSGPDFFNAQIIIGTQKWAGTVEIHLKSSDWYLHNHHSDAAYENVILHVVWEHDADIFRIDNSVIPVLEIKHFVAADLIDNYHKLLQPKSWIYCQADIQSVDSALLSTWKQRLFFERLQRKSNAVDVLAKEYNSDWEAILFYQLAKNFGLNTNGEAFFAIAKAITFAIFRKEIQNPLHLEALLLGFAGLLNCDFEEVYPQQLKTQFAYLKIKYKLIDATFGVAFFKHRPDNFPTIRLSQFAQLYFTNKDIFSAILAANDLKGLYTIFNVSTHEYWQSHYQLDRVSPFRRKPLSRSFVNLLIINTIIPVRFAFEKSRGVSTYDSLLQMLMDIPPESNVVISKFDAIGIKCKDVMDSQALLELKGEYCNKGLCLRCLIGSELLKANAVS